MRKICKNIVVSFTAIWMYLFELFENIWSNLVQLLYPYRIYVFIVSIVYILLIGVLYIYAILSHNI